MSKINGDKKRDHLRARKQTKMREKMRELRATMKPVAAKPAPAAAAETTKKPA